MNLNEIFDGHYTEKDDNTALTLSDVRKTKLTLAQLNRLRILNDVRRFEHENDLGQVQLQYKPPQESNGMM